MGKGYYLEHLCVQDLKNQGFFAFRIPTASQVGEMSKIDVIYTKDIHFVQCKVTKKRMSARDKVLMLRTADKYRNAGATAELCWLKDNKSKRGIKYEYLQSNTRYRPKTKISDYK
jgi:Holliday junction resolvase-like predicted endonuclease